MSPTAWKFKQDKVQFTAENYIMLCVCVCGGEGELFVGGGEGDVI